LLNKQVDEVEKRQHVQNDETVQLFTRLLKEQEDRHNATIDKMQQQIDELKGKLQSQADVQLA